MAAVRPARHKISKNARHTQFNDSLQLLIWSQTTDLHTDDVIAYELCTISSPILHDVSSSTTTLSAVYLNKLNVGVMRLQMRPVHEWVIRKIGSPTTSYQLNRLLSAKRENDP